MSSSMHKQFPVPLEQQQNIHQSIKNEPINVHNSQESTESATACYQQQQDKSNQQQSYQKEAVSLSSISKF